MNRIIGAGLGGLARVLARSTKRAADEAPERILVVKTHAIGDLLMVTPGIAALRQLFPNAHIAALSGRWSAEILVGNPDLDETIEFPDELLFGHKVGGLLRLASQIQAKRFDLACIFQASAPVQMLIALAGIPERIGFDLNGSGCSLTRRLDFSPNSERFVGDNYMDVPRALGFEGEMPPTVLNLSDNEKEEAFQIHLAETVAPDTKLIAVCPGGGKNPRDKVNAKLWPADRFAQVASKLAREIGARVLVLGGPDDENMLRNVMDLLPFKGIKPTGTTLRELACLISFSSLLITNDSAPVHIAAALGVPCVAVYGPSNPLAVAPPVATHHVVRTTAECSPCYSNERFPGCDRPFCISMITTESVLAEARKALEERG